MTPIYKKFILNKKHSLGKYCVLYADNTFVSLIKLFLKPFIGLKTKNSGLLFYKLEFFLKNYNSLGKIMYLQVL